MLKTNRYWFRPKWYGYGVVPITWEGWLATFIFGLGVVLAGYVDGIWDEPMILRQVGRFSLDIFLLSAAFLLVFRHRIRGELKWCWGSS